MSTLPIQPPPVSYAPPGVLGLTPADSPLKPEHLAQLAAAQKRQKKLNRAISVATFDAWATAVFAVPTFIFALFSLPALDGLFIGLALCVAAFNSFRGMGLLKRLDLRAPRVLGFNQIFIALSISLYAAWQMLHPASSTIVNDPQVKEMLGDIQLMITQIYTIFYGIVILATWLAQGSASIYYFTRKGTLETYLAETPKWIHDVKRAQV